MRALFASLLVLAAAVAFAQSDVSRKVIHEELYKPTPGDVYSLTINYGVNPASDSTEKTETIPLILQADDTLTVPYIGAIDVTGLSYADLQKTIASQVKQRLLVPYVSLTLTAPAVYDVFIWGNVTTPGYHTVTSLNRLIEALGTAGGISSSGSHRRIQIRRGNEVNEYDLVAFAAMGDERQNPYIRPGDKIYVPIALSAAQIAGAVANPGTYELLGEETIGDIISLAGGPLPTALEGRASLNRLDTNNRYAVVDLANIDLTSIPAQSGDLITIPASTSKAETILVEGAIHTGPAQEGTPRAVPMEPVLLEVPYTPGMTVLRVLDKFGGITNFAEPEKSFLIRGEDGRREPIPDLGMLWDERQWDRDIALSPGDRLVVPMKRLVVAVGGEVNSPGGFPFTTGYTVGDYVELAGGVTENNGSINELYFADKDGKLTRVTTDTPVPVGASIYVGRSAWGATKFAFGNILVVTGWISTFVALATAILDLLAYF